jgi:hypothetical protein
MDLIEKLVSDDGVQRVYRVYDAKGRKVGVRQEFIGEPGSAVKVRRAPLRLLRRLLRLTPMKAGLVGGALTEVVFQLFVKGHL